jgi:hypothetical protein
MTKAAFAAALSNESPGDWVVIGPAGKGRWQVYICMGSPSHTAVRSTVIPSFSATRRDTTFCSLIIETIRSSPTREHAWSRHAKPASVAIPVPEYGLRTIQPSSTFGTPSTAVRIRAAVADKLSGGPEDDRAPAEAVRLVARQVALDPPPGLRRGRPPQPSPRARRHPRAAGTSRRGRRRTAGVVSTVASPAAADRCRCSCTHAQHGRREGGRERSSVTRY